MSAAKLYVLAADDVPEGFAVNGVAHAGVCAGLRWYNDDVFRKWAVSSFRKVTCRASPDDIAKCEAALARHIFIAGDSGKLDADDPAAIARILDDERIIVRESDLDNRVVAVIFKPRKEWPECFKQLAMWGAQP